MIVALLAYLAVGVLLDVLIMFVLVIREDLAGQDLQDVALLGAAIIVAWPLVLFLGILLGVPCLIFVSVRGAIRAHEMHKWRKHRRSLG